MTPKLSIADLIANPTVQTKGKKKGIPDKCERITDLYTKFDGSLLDSMATVQEYLRDLKPRQVVMCMSNGTWSIEHLIIAVIEQVGTVDLWVASWVVASRSILRLVKAKQQGFIRDAYFVVDESLGVNRPNDLSVLQVNFGHNKLGLMACHAKVYVIKSINPNGMQFTILSSANLNKNPRAESSIIIEGKEPAEFYSSWIEDQIRSGNAYRFKFTGQLKEQNESK